MLTKVDDKTSEQFSIRVDFDGQDRQLMTRKIAAWKALRRSEGITWIGARILQLINATGHTSKIHNTPTNAPSFLVFTFDRQIAGNRDLAPIQGKQVVTNAVAECLRELKSA